MKGKENGKEAKAEPRVPGKQEEGYTLERLLSIVDNNMNSLMPAPNMFPMNTTELINEGAIGMQKVNQIKEVERKVAAESNYIDLEQRRIQDAEEALAKKAKELGKVS